MKKLGTITAAVVVALGLTTSAAIAADKHDRDRVTMRDGGHVDSKDLIGMRVETMDGKRAGKIDRLLFDRGDGKISHAVVGLGGVAGVGKKQVVVPWSQVRISRDAKKSDKMVAMIDRGTLDSAPRYSARFDRDYVPSASPGGDRDRDGVPNRVDRAPSNPKKY